MHSFYRQSYWLFQILGWSVYTMSQFIAYYILLNPTDKDLENLAYNVTVNICMGILLTHSFRFFFNRYRWIKLSVPRLTVRVVLYFFLINSLFTLANIYLDEELLDTSKSSKILSYISYLINNGKPLLIWMLIYLFYAFMVERRDAVIERIKMQASIDSSEAKILRAQINPHFMFNALNSIRALVFEDPNKAQKGITQLSNLLRSSLVADRKTSISLQEEFKTIEDYLDLEKVRYEERLQISWHVSPETLKIEVPPMILQTLVENAIKHGVQNATPWGFIEISSNIDHNFLKIKIRNSGELKSTVNTKIDGGFGLENTQKRLKLMFGQKAKFDIFQEKEGVVSSCISIPLFQKQNI
jgi:two-component system, LytTR family, sensor kinase